LVVCFGGKLQQLCFPGDILKKGFYCLWRKSTSFLSSYKRQDVHAKLQVPHTMRNGNCHKAAVELIVPNMGVTILF
jgi:hypothetical protein